MFRSATLRATKPRFCAGLEKTALVPERDRAREAKVKEKSSDDRRLGAVICTDPQLFSHGEQVQG